MLLRLPFCGGKLKLAKLGKAEEPKLRPPFRQFVNGMLPKVDFPEPPLCVPLSPEERGKVFGLFGAVAGRRMTVRLMGRSAVGGLGGQVSAGALCGRSVRPVSR
ncbi:hypothetical protein ABZ904_38175 [Streptomyces sp. NPDC046900]|uniref:hypothetical protein n=1 Tax=Streptomyces sp. NPDC046900 TaxID=3155473 RepID=UPI0033CF889E